MSRCPNTRWATGHQQVDRLGVRVHRVLGMATAAVVAASGCGRSAITSTRIEASVAATFANLVNLQLSRLNLGDVAASDIKARAACRKAEGDRRAVGAGDWVCTLDWSGPNHIPLRDTYDLSVAANGCYTATVDRGEAHLGGPSVAMPDGSHLRNLLYTFDGCFDTT